MPLLYAQIQGAKIKEINYDTKFVFDYEKFKNVITKNTEIKFLTKYKKSP